mgnify:CR=1 FL=1
MSVAARSGRMGPGLAFGSVGAGSGLRGLALAVGTAGQSGRLGATLAAVSFCATCSAGMTEIHEKSVVNIHTASTLTSTGDEISETCCCGTAVSLDSPANTHRCQGWPAQTQNAMPHCFDTSEFCDSDTY